MGAQLLTTPAIVLSLDQSGDNWIRTTCFSARDGNLDCLVRISRRSAANAPALDLFDEVQLTLETRSQGRTWFLKEGAIERRRSGLGRSYGALLHASRFSRILMRNPVHEESRAQVYELLRRALDAWESTPRSDCVYLKTLFLLARDEGYPVHQDWRPRLKRADREAAGAVLRQPAAEQTTPEPTVARLIQELEHYLRHHTDIVIED